MSETTIGRVLDPATLSGKTGEKFVTGTRRVLVRDLVLPCEIGTLKRERGAHQRVRINLELGVHEAPHPIDDDLRNVVCYDEIVTGIRAIVAAGHINLVETLAERIAAMCLADQRVAAIRVRVEKLDVYPDAGSVGVEIFRANPLPAEGSGAGNPETGPVSR